MLPPFDIITGNASGAQDLRYAENDNKAYESPAGSVNYARNYRPSFIISENKKTGRAYFAVKKRSAVHMTSKAKKAMAVLGGAGALYASLVRTKSSAIYVAIYAQWLALQELGSTTSFRKWVTSIFMAGLRTKAAQFAFTGPNNTSYVNNPWVATTQTEGCTIGSHILRKFFSELALNPIKFYVDGIEGIAHSGDTWNNAVSLNAGYMTFENSPQGNLIINDKYVKLEQAYVTFASTITANAEYVLTDVEP